jgi:serine protease
MLFEDIVVAPINITKDSTMPKKRLALTFLSLILLLVGCSQTGVPNAPSSISGTVGVGSVGTGTAVLSRDTVLRNTYLRSITPPTAAEADFVPGEVIVKFKPTLSLQSVRRLQLKGGTLEAIRPLALPSVQLYRSTAGREETLKFVRELNARPDVAYAQPNYILKALNVPNDAFYAAQWHYPALNLPQAWDITTGSSDTVVAVVDSGILYDPADAGRTHPDFVGKVLSGYDFVSDPTSASDGDGRDPNAFDEGTLNTNGLHGSHVAGTIAAATNDGSGVAGVNWNAQILPVRVMGADGSGNFADIYEGVLWAAGLDIPGVPANPYPAQVINMSLGGPPACTPYEQDVLSQVTATGTIVVVAAGNENVDAGGSGPASCAGVITVGATDFQGARAYYSNFGSTVDVMAPGGDTNADLNGDGYPDGVLSVSQDPVTGEFTSVLKNGTSMAAPHVAGVVSLMRALRPDLTGDEALTILRSTARPLSAAQCNRPLAGDCGAGLVDAYAALQSLSSPTPPPAPGGALSFSPNPLDFGVESTELPLTLTNTSGTSLEWQIVAFDVYEGNPGQIPDGTFYLPAGTLSGTLEAGGSATVTLGADRTLISAEGVYALDLIFSVSGNEQRLPVRLTKGSASVAMPSGPFTVVAAVRDAQGNYVPSGSQQSETFFPAYNVNVTPGENAIYGWADENGNGKIDQGDFLGTYPQLVPVAAGQSVQGVDFNVTQVIEVGTLQARLGVTPHLREVLERTR